jgi:hypothetical protein
MNPLPLADAVEHISAKTPIGATLRSKEWQEVPAALRRRAQLSAGVESARLLQTLQDRLQAQLALQREQLASGETATFDRSSFINAIRDLAEAEGVDTRQGAEDTGTLKDIRSIPRLGLIYDMQTQQAQGYARWKLDQSEGALMLYPAWEFKRLQARAQPRADWPQRWRAAGGQFFAGRMIALKNDPLWAKLSRFGQPWPPFDFASGMGVDDIDYDEAVQLGLLKPGEEVPPTAEKDFNDGLAASVKGLDPALRDQLKRQFGDQIQIQGDTVQWALPNTEMAAEPPPDLPEGALEHILSGPLGDLAKATPAQAQDRVRQTVAQFSEQFRQPPVTDITLAPLKENTYADAGLARDGKPFIRLNRELFRDPRKLAAALQLEKEDFALRKAGIAAPKKGGQDILLASRPSVMSTAANPLDALAAHETMHTWPHFNAALLDWRIRVANALAGGQLSRADILAVSLKAGKNHNELLSELAASLHGEGRDKIPQPLLTLWDRWVNHHYKS